MIVKICGLSTIETVDAACAAGADFIGFVFYPPSPRAIAPATAASLHAHVAGRARTVGLFVDAGADEISSVLDVVPLDGLQLHGRDTPAALAAMRERFGRLILKPVSVDGPAAIEGAAAYAGACDWLLLDAPPPKDATRPGGNAVAFDWRVLSRTAPSQPWMLAGGLTPDNVADAIRQTGARAVDVSSGVESSRGIKDPALIAAFVTAARSAEPVEPPAPD